MVKRPTPGQRCSKHLCADAGYPSKTALKIILAHCYIPHVVGRKSEALRKKRDPKKKARRWVVEVCHGWFNRFRKLLARYEKLEHTFLALNHLVAARSSCFASARCLLSCKVCQCVLPKQCLPECTLS